MPKLFPFAKIKAGKSKKLRATAARRPLRIAATSNYDEMSEPNMKLSRALLIVLLLHVVAVSGIIAFNAIKTRQASNMPRPKTATTSLNTADPSTNNTVSRLPGGQRENPKHEETKSSRGSAKSTAKDDHKTERSKPDESSRVYVVAKGDNPAGIAKKLKVPYDELLALNHIDDPRKLQIGQKLLVPSKTTKGKKSEE